MYTWIRALMLISCMGALHAMHQEDSKTGASFLNGFFAGGIEVMVSNPLIVLKNDLIVRSKKEFKDASHQRSVLAFMQKYYKGCGIGVLFMCPITALQNSTACILSDIFKKNDSPTPAQKTLAAFLGGFCSAMIESPADLVVLHRQNPAYKSERISDTWRRIYNAGGLPTFYRGIIATGLRDGTIVASYKMGAHLLETLLPGHENPVHSLACNVVAACIGATISQPADVISARMKHDLAELHYRGYMQTFQKIFKEEGYKALLQGLVPRGTRVLLAVPLLHFLTEKEVGTMLLNKI